LIARTGSATLGRKLPVVGGLLMATTIVAASFVHNDAAVVGVMSFVFFGQGMCNLGWTLITDVAPRQFMGLTAGLFNLCANVAGIATPMVVGFIVGGTGSFSFALAYISALALLGVFSYVFLLGPVKRIEIPDSFGVVLVPAVHE
jgi:MFS transporter, ACS family, D-galactonate transporter